MDVPADRVVRRAADIAADYHADLIKRLAMAEELNALYATRVAELEQQAAQLQEKRAVRRKKPAPAAEATPPEEVSP